MVFCSFFVSASFLPSAAQEKVTRSFPACTDLSPRGSSGSRRWLYLKGFSVTLWGLAIRTRISQGLSSPLTLQQIPETRKRKDKEKGRRPWRRAFLWKLGVLG